MSSFIVRPISRAVPTISARLFSIIQRHQHFHNNDDTKNNPPPPTSSSSSLAPSQLQSIVNMSRPISQPTHYTHPHLLTPSQVTPNITRLEYQSRRQQLSKHLPPNSLSILTSNPQLYMSEDVPFPYHPNTDLLYLIGIHEPDITLLIHRSSSNSSDSDKTTYILFVNDRDPTKELWDGPTCGPCEDVRLYFGVDDIQSFSEFSSTVADILPSCESFHFDSSVNQEVTQSVISKFLSTSPSRVKDDDRNLLRRTWKIDMPPKNFILPLRLRKSTAELHLMRKASSITSHALNSAMANTYSDNNDSSLTEAEIDARITNECLSNGATRMAFPSVVASGKNATVLHYMRKDSLAIPGSLVMVDSGCEYHQYCSDVSRTWPISSKFTSEQKDLYDIVLESQSKVLEQTKVGISLDDLHTIGAKVITQGLLDLGFMKGNSLESALTTGVYSKYFPHAVGHYLGSDVHDTHRVSKAIKLEKGMVVTVEPGLYVRPNDDNVPVGFRGIGIRVEDDVVVGGEKDGSPEILSKDAVKLVDDIEHLVGSAVSAKNR